MHCDKLCFGISTIFNVSKCSRKKSLNPSDIFLVQIKVTIIFEFNSKNNCLFLTF